MPTGAVRFIGSPDFEAPADAGGNNVYDIIVQVYDGTLTHHPGDGHHRHRPERVARDHVRRPTARTPRTTAVTTVTATDPDAGATITYSMTGGADAALFTIDATAGVLSFIGAPNFEAPADAGGNNVYDITVQVYDGTLDRHPGVAITVTDLNEAPAITSAAAVKVAENRLRSTTVTATDPDAGARSPYSIAGGADAALFTIDATTGAVPFISAPNFEAPADAGGNNVYDITVQVSDGTLTASQAIAVTVTNLNEAPTTTSELDGRQDRRPGR